MNPEIMKKNSKKRTKKRRRVMNLKNASVAKVDAN